MLTGDKYDLFRPVCNRPGKKKKKDRQEGVWGLGAEGLWGGGGGGDSYCRRPRPRWRQCAQRCRRCWSNFTACPPHLPSPTHTFIHLQPASPHLPYLSLSSLSLFRSSLPPSPVFSPPSLPPFSYAQERPRGQEPSGSLEQQG